MSYKQALDSAIKARGGPVTDAQMMAVVLDSIAQITLGAVSPALIWEGAQKKGMTTAELTALIDSDPKAAADLMWE